MIVRLLIECISALDTTIQAARMSTFTVLPNTSAALAAAHDLAAELLNKWDNPSQGVPTAFSARGPLVTDDRPLFPARIGDKVPDDAVLVLYACAPAEGPEIEVLVKMKWKEENPQKFVAVIAAAEYVLGSTINDDPDSVTVLGHGEGMKA